MWIRTLTCIVILAASLGQPLVAAEAQAAIPAALEWLRSQQLPDGGFSNGFSEGSDLGATADAVIAIAAAGEDPSRWETDGASPVDFLSANAAEIDSPGQAAKTVLAVIAAGENPRQFAGLDLVTMVSSGLDPATGFCGSGVFDTGLCLLALEAADEPIPSTAVDALVRARLPDGSYAFTGETTPGGGDSNTTALVVQALLAAGAGSEVGPSFAYFREAQNADGGWTYQKPSAFGEDTDANSTALVIQALLAGGQDLSTWGHPVRALEALQQSSGAFSFNAATPGDNFLATVQAIPALAEVDLTDIARLPAGYQQGTASSTSILVTVLVVLAALLAASTLLGGSRRTEG